MHKGNEEYPMKVLCECCNTRKQTRRCDLRGIICPACDEALEDMEEVLEDSE